MTVIYSIIKKDLRKFWLLTLIWTIFLIVTPYFEGVHFKGDYETFIMSTPQLSILFIFRILKYFIPFFIITPLIVHEDGLIKSDAFWITRPISGLQLFLSKGITLFILTVLIPSLSELATLLFKELPLNEMFLTWIDIILYQLLTLMPFFFISSITINFYQYIMYLVLLAGTYLTAFLILLSARSLIFIPTLDFTYLFAFHISPVIVDSLLIILLFIAIINTQYLYRRRFLNILLFLLIFSSYSFAIILQDLGQSRKNYINTSNESSLSLKIPHLEANIVNGSSTTNVSNSNPELKSFAVNLLLESTSPIMAFTVQKADINFSIDDGSTVGIKKGYLETAPGLTLSGAKGVNIRESGLEKMLATEFGTEIHILNKRNYEISFSLSSKNGEVEKILSHTHTTDVQFQIGALQLKKSFSVRANETQTRIIYPSFISSIPYNSPSMHVLSQEYLFVLATKIFTRNRVDEPQGKRLFSIDEDTIDILLNSKTGEAMILNKVKGYGDGMHSPFIQENIEQFSLLGIDNHQFQITKEWMNEAEFIRYKVIADATTFSVSAHSE